MLRSILAVALTLVLLVSSAFAEEIKATFVKYENKELTVKVDGAEKKFKVADDAITKVKDKEMPADKMLSNPKLKEGTSLILVVDKDVVKEVKRVGKKKN